MVLVPSDKFAGFETTTLRFHIQGVTNCTKGKKEQSVEVDIQVHLAI